jgi:hypothetical protein
VQRRRAELARLDPASALPAQAERVLAGAARAERALEQLDPEAAAAALQGLDPQLPAVQALRRRGEEMTARRARAEKALDEARAASDPALARGKAREAMSLWPGLQRDAQAVLAAVDAAATKPPVAAAPASTPPPAPAPTPAATAAPAAPDPKAAVARALDAYAAALRAKDIGALADIWPSIPGAEKKKIEESFRFARSHQVELRVERVTPRGDAFEAQVARHDRIQTEDGQVVENDSRAVFLLKRRGDDLVIDGIQTR